MQFGSHDLSSALAILTAMITPAVLISACGTLILSTSTRMGRTVDRVRSLLDRLEVLADLEEEIKLYEERRKFIYDQLDLTAKRNRLLQRAMATFYGALGVFIACSVSIGLVSLTGRGYEWLPAALGLIGASFLFYGSVLLILETRIASHAVFSEMDFTLHLSKEFVSDKIIKERSEKAKSRFSPFIRLVHKKPVQTPEDAD